MTKEQRTVDGVTFPNLKEYLQLVEDEAVKYWKNDDEGEVRDEIRYHKKDIAGSYIYEFDKWKNTPKEEWGLNMQDRINHLARLTAWNYTAQV